MASRGSKQKQDEPEPDVLNDEPLNDEARAIQREWQAHFQEMKFWERHGAELNAYREQVVTTNIKHHTGVAAKLEGRFHEVQNRAKTHRDQAPS